MRLGFWYLFIISAMLLIYCIAANAQELNISPGNQHTQIGLPKVFGDSMVLQRGIRIPVWGSATPGTLIIAKLGNVQAKARVNKQGKWKISFPVFKAGGPY